MPGPSPIIGVLLSRPSARYRSVGNSNNAHRKVIVSLRDSQHIKSENVSMSLITISGITRPSSIAPLPARPQSNIKRPARERASSVPLSTIQHGILLSRLSYIYNIRGREHSALRRWTAYLNMYAFGRQNTSSRAELRAWVVRNWLEVGEVHGVTLHSMPSTPSGPARNSIAGFSDAATVSLFKSPSSASQTFSWLATYLPHGNSWMPQCTHC